MAPISHPVARLDMSTQTNFRNRQSGATLLEVLVAIVVVSLGLLGYAGLQIASLHNSQSAYKRSQATMLAYDIIDTMRADKVNALGTNYDVTIGDKNGKIGQVKDWKQRIGDSLPQGDGSIIVDLTGVATVKVQWTDDRDGNTLAFATQTRLKGDY